MDAKQSSKVVQTFIVLFCAINSRHKVRLNYERFERLFNSTFQ